MRIGLRFSPFFPITLLIAGALAASACGNGSANHLGDDATGDDASAGNDAAGDAQAVREAGAPEDSGPPPVRPVDGSVTTPTIVECGGSCNLSTQTCCLGVDALGNPTGKCIQHGAKCPILTAAFTCGGAVDCPAGKVCCGQADSTAMTAGTSCTDTCPTQSNAAQTQGSAQVCRGSAECQNRMECIAQVCRNQSKFNLCGLTSQDPFQCQPQ
jgi:hypothetical protein